MLHSRSDTGSRQGVNGQQCVRAGLEYKNKVGGPCFLCSRKQSGQEIGCSQKKNSRLAFFFSGVLCSLSCWILVPLESQSQPSHIYPGVFARLYWLIIAASPLPGSPAVTGISPIPKGIFHDQLVCSLFSSDWRIPSRREGSHNQHPFPPLLSPLGPLRAQGKKYERERKCWSFDTLMLCSTTVHSVRIELACRDPHGKRVPPPTDAAERIMTRAAQSEEPLSRDTPFGGSEMMTETGGKN